MGSLSSIHFSNSFILGDSRPYIRVIWIYVTSCIRNGDLVKYWEVFNIQFTAYSLQPTVCESLKKVR